MMKTSIRKASIATSTLCQVCRLVDGMVCCKLCNRIACIRCTKFKDFCFFCSGDERNSFVIKNMLKEKKKKEFYDKHFYLKYLCCFQENKKNQIKPL